MSSVRLYNSLSDKKEGFEPLKSESVTLYSCGPTVYNTVHIGNLLSFIMADTLRRALTIHGYKVHHVMNFTDIDDKTIKTSQLEHPELDPMDRLKKSTRVYEAKFLEDSQAIGIDIASIEFIRATDTIESMQNLISELIDAEMAYVADDGIYFSISAYKKSGKKYGQLVQITEESTGAARVNNDEYDKDHIHDFALWKAEKPGEPSWDYEYKNQKMAGRPGWHIECSAMSAGALGQPFDIHTGGVDLKFPHHENEIAQSTAAVTDPVMAKFFLHNEHVMIDGQKMSKSLDNFYTLSDIKAKDFDPLIFRLFALQSHYRSRSDFSWLTLESARVRLQTLRSLFALRFQASDFTSEDEQELFTQAAVDIKDALADDLNTPKVLSAISGVQDALSNEGASSDGAESFNKLLELIDFATGLKLMETKDIKAEQKDIIAKREEARSTKDFVTADKLRSELADQGIGINDGPNGPIWYFI